MVIDRVRGECLRLVLPWMILEGGMMCHWLRMYSNIVANSALNLDPHIQLTVLLQASSW